MHLFPGVLLALIAGRFAKTEPQFEDGPDIDVFGEEENVNKPVAEKKLLIIILKIFWILKISKLMLMFQIKIQRLNI